MSENILKLIPKSPAYVPQNAMLQRACEMLTNFFPEARRVNCESTEQVSFIHQGQNWERVLCPTCKAELDSEWWRQAMKDASRTGFQDLSVATPCCGKTESLNDLQYEWPAGFARCVLEVYSPGGDINERQLGTLEKALDCGLRKIWTRI